ncbi:hypothetical protein TNCT_409271 [Trichonephila clavata]|uniref:Uncharacterized protein n=1 Tax=Trichonephila clavata TaxID=2740835 RepID=A0A8X6F635_TRICU|nr:hypothetical protein TNCT_409271 [Trichonephila clavata]
MARWWGLVHIEKSLASALTVPGSTLRGFPRCLALKKPPAVPLGTLEKCGYSGTAMELEAIRVFAKKGDKYRENRFASYGEKRSTSFASRGSEFFLG